MIKSRKIFPKTLIVCAITAALAIVLYLVALSSQFFSLSLFGQNVQSLDIDTSTFLVIFCSKGILLTCLVLLTRILIVIINEDAFQTPIIRRFYTSGLLVLLLPVINSIGITVMARNQDLAQFMFGNVQLVLIESLINRVSTFLIIGILILSFAHVLKQGLLIYEEQKLTV